jgi:hypothetical protein
MTFNDFLNIAILTIPWLLVYLYMERSEKRFREKRILINQIESLQLELRIKDNFINKFTINTEEAKQTKKTNQEFIDFYNQTIATIFLSKYYVTKKTN